MTLTRRLSGVTRMGSSRFAARRVVTSNADLRIAMQPIIAVSNGSVLAVEALARFADRTNTEAVFSTAYTPWGRRRTRSAVSRGGPAAA